MSETLDCLNTLINDVVRDAQNYGISMLRPTLIASMICSQIMVIPETWFTQVR